MTLRTIQASELTLGDLADLTTMPDQALCLCPAFEAVRDACPYIPRTSSTRKSASSGRVARTVLVKPAEDVREWLIGAEDEGNATSKSMPTPLHATPAPDRWDTVEAAACALYQAQMNVFPVQPASKEPYGRHGFLRATRLAPATLPYLMAGSNLAVMTGRLSEYLFILDCDDSETYVKIGKELAARDIHPWVRNSVRGGQYWLLSAEGEIANTKIRKIDVLGNRTYTLAPPSVHPSGMIYEWVERPGAVPPLVRLSDLGFLTLRLERAAKRKPPRDGKTVLPEVAHEVLVEQDTSRYEDDHSAAEYAACLSLLGAGFGTDHIIGLFSMYAPPHFSRVGKADFSRAILSKAAAYRERPGNETYRTRLGHSSQFMAWAESAAWPGRTGNSDKAAYRALCERMHNEGGMPFRASIREIAELANMSKQTAHKAVHRLIETGLVSWDSADKQTDAYRYTLHMPIAEECILGTPSPTGDVGMPTVPIMNSSHDAWHANALGKSALYVYTALRERGALSAPAIARATGKAPCTVWRALTKLAKCEMVKQADGLWQAQDVSAETMDRIAERCGTLGRTDLRGERHQLERECRASRIIGKQKQRWETQQAHQAAR